MKFHQFFWFLGSLGLVLLTSRGTIAAPPLSPTPQAKPKLGGIPATCYVQYVNQMRPASRQEGELFQVFKRYEADHEDALVLRLAETLDSKQFLEPKRSALNWLIQDALQTGAKAKAAALLPQALQLEAQAVKPTTEKAIALEHIGRAFAAVAQPKQAAAALEQSNQVFQRLDTFESGKIEFSTSIAGEYTAIAKPQLAIALLNQTVQHLRSLPDSEEMFPLQPKFALLAKASFQYAAAGQPAQADALFAESLALANTPQNIPKAGQQLPILFKAIAALIPADELAQLPDAQQASLLADQQKKYHQVIEPLMQLFTSPQLPDFERSVLAQQLAKIWVTTHQMDQAVQFASQLKHPTDQFLVLINLVDPEGEGSPANQVVPLLGQTRDIARLIQGEHRDYALTRVATAYVKLGQPQPALDLLREMPSQNANQVAKATVADALADAGQPDLALALIRTLPPEISEMRLLKIAQAYAKLGQFDQALSSANRMTQEEVRDSALAEIAAQLVKAGDTRRAIAIFQPVTEPITRIVTFHGLANQALDNGDLDQAWDFIQQIPPSPERRSLVGEMATAYAEAGQYPKALQIAQTRSDQSLMQLLTCAQSAVAKP